MKKTIEEVAEEYALRSECAMFEQNAIKHFKAGVEFAQRWISVEDELPEIMENGYSKNVLVKKDNGNIAISHYLKSKDCFCCDLAHRIQVIAWRPIEY
jgi:hypothetical protein